jgi:hypothetical protein
MTETREFIDFTHLEPVRVSRWDRGDGEGAIVSLVKALDDAGLPGELARSRELLDQAERLGEAARAAKMAAVERLARADEALAATADMATYGQELGAVGPYLDDDAAAMVGAMRQVHRTRANAVQTAMAEASGIYQRLQVVAREVVGHTAALPSLPRQAWAASSTAAASQAAIEAGYGRSWEDLVLLGVRWDSIHAAAALVRETGALSAQLMFPAGCPTAIGVMFLNWEPAVEAVRELRHLPGPLRIRGAVDRDLKPGLYLRDDHERAAAEKPKRPLEVLAGWVGR